MQAIKELRLAVTQNAWVDTRAKGIPSYICLTTTGNVFRLFGKCCPAGNYQPMGKYRSCVMPMAHNNVQRSGGAKPFGSPRGAQIPQARRWWFHLPQRGWCPVWYRRPRLTLTLDRVDAEALNLRIHLALQYSA